ncbi:toxin glutamine deamidase domain-containing protein [Xanthomonas sontii]|uniref:toxin glutamine deamidase domain-containing protein n=1 Tax=Xanthomonas sontii TaxID=2650745 RepID=UPI0011E45548|nr:hypothetical protein CEK63_11560 [Xanthomonas sontii]UZK08964.1 hypothetical protein CJ027_020875 [Xanthomonas sontii]
MARQHRRGNHAQWRHRADRGRPRPAPASALPINSTDGVSITVLEKQFGTKFVSVPSAESIYQKMIDIGAGARGIVYGSYGPGQPGHVFNVVNQNGAIRFLDGQTGKAADLDKFKSFKFLRTNQ